MVHYSNLFKHSYRCTLVCSSVCEYIYDSCVHFKHNSDPVIQYKFCCSLCKQCMEVRNGFALEELLVDICSTTQRTELPFPVSGALLVSFADSLEI